jgi:outer membrane lipoprotein-sorting protein
MKRIPVTLTVLGLAIGLSIASAAAQDKAQQIKEGKKIWGKLIDAMGGRERLLKIKDTKASSDVTMFKRNISGSLVVYQKGNKMRQDIQLMGMAMTQAFNGETAWITNPQTGAALDMPEPMLGEFKREAISNAALISPDKYDVIFTSEGQKTVGNKKYIILKMTYKDGHKNTIYLDPATYLPYKTVNLGLTDYLEKTERETITSEYRDVEGTRVPFSVKIIEAGKDYMTITLKEYKYNSNLEDSLFNKK